MTLQSRELSPEWRAAGWLSYGELLMWCHTPSGKVVKIDSARFDRCIGIGAYPADPKDPSTDGFVVGWCHHAESGEPDGDYQLVWVESYGTALLLATECRRRILGETPAPTPNRQTTFDDLLRRIGEP